MEPANHNMNMDFQRVDLNRICRTCKNVTPVMRSLFEGFQISEQNTRIDEMLMACTSIQVSCADGLPVLICEICVEQLKNSFLFKQQCEKTEISLKEYAKNTQNIKQELQHTDFLDTINNLLTDATEPKDMKQIEVVPPAPALESLDQQTDFIRLMENNQMILTCRECGKVFTTLEGLRGHKRMHTGGMFKCKQCDKEYTRLNHLQRHELSHGRRKVHVCRICNKTLTRMEHLKRHLVTHLREKPFSCNTCNRGFNRVEHLLNHASKCKGENVFICNVCNKAFNREDSLEVHKKLHDNLEPVLPTLENLDNIEDHYYEIDFDSNTVLSDNDDDNDNDERDVDDCFEPQIHVTETMDEENLIAVAQVTEPEDKNSDTLEAHDDTFDNSEGDAASLDDHNIDSNSQSGQPQSKIELGEVGLEEDEKQNNENECAKVIKRDDDEEYIPDTFMDAGEVASDSDDSEYLPRKQVSPKVKRGRGRPRKYPPKPPRVPGKRGRKPGTQIKKELQETETVGEFPCDSCKQIFPTISKLMKHVGKEHKEVKPHKCEVCGKIFNKANHLRRHMISHSTEKPFQCLICTKSFHRKDHLIQHTKLHDRPNDYQCEACMKSFARADHLAKHKASKHGIGERIPGEKKFQCTICNKAFTTEKYREIHEKGHNGEKQFECKTCSKTFLSKSHLTEHIKFHNEHSKKFLCSECGQRFIRNDYLVIHMRRHRGEKPFKCKFCGKGFPRTTDLTVHERYHTGEKTHLCTICGRGFGRAYNLTVHMRTHTGEKPYQCTYCDAAFAQGNDLKAHVRRHTGERFQCELCNENFLMGYLLTQHKRSVHGLNVVSNIRRLQPVHKVEQNADDPPPITISLPKPVVPDSIRHSFHAQLALAQLQLARE